MRGIQRLRFFVSNDTALFAEMMGGFRNLPAVGSRLLQGNGRFVERVVVVFVVRVAEALKLFYIFPEVSGI